ncbi:hypothetical protein BRADI_1g56075v3 [Brachypodium distachyon]|uniref:Uncharacterized protein n=1 Tax=Brachypodium distachyon TaxID=15368 RepID=A0A0Q3S6B2_BRADI|nr:hypothetical protein BRADI_1g56075v3 [Brachypodium distachyon]
MDAAVDWGWRAGAVSEQGVVAADHMGDCQGFLALISDGPWLFPNSSAANCSKMRGLLRWVKRSSRRPSSGLMRPTARHPQARWPSFVDRCGLLLGSTLLYSVSVIDKVWPRKVRWFTGCRHVSELDTVAT